MHLKNHEIILPRKDCRANGNLLNESCETKDEKYELWKKEECQKKGRRYLI